MSEPPLKLRAQDAEDVQVLAAVLQDAIAPVCDMVYRPEEKNFIMIVHRFRWDCLAPKESPCFERVRCALDIRGVDAVQRHGFDQGECSRMLDLLTVGLEGDDLKFIFAGDARLKLKLVNGLLRLEDFGEPWPTAHQPRHAT